MLPHTFESREPDSEVCAHCDYVEDKTWHVPGHYMATGEKVIENCLLCGIATPSGHVPAYKSDGERAGRVCSGHTLRQVIRSLRFIVTIEYDNRGVN